MASERRVDCTDGAGVLRVALDTARGEKEAYRTMEFRETSDENAVNRKKTPALSLERVFQVSRPGRVNKGTPPQNFKQEGKYEVLSMVVVCWLAVGPASPFWPTGACPGP